MLNRIHEDLFSTPLPRRFAMSLVDAGRGSPGSGSGPGGSAGPGDNDGPSGAGGVGGAGGGGVGIGPDGLVGLGDERGGMSSIGADGEFTGVVDPDLGFIGTIGANMATNLGIAMGKVGDTSTFGKLGLAVTAMSKPGLVAVAGLTMGLKSVAQALSTPGLSAADKAEISKTANAMNTMSPEDISALSAEVNDMVEGDGGPSGEGSGAGTATGSGATTGTGASSTVDGPAPGTWDHYVNQFFGTEEGMKSAKTMLQEQADYVAQQFETWLGDSTSDTDTYTDQMGTYTKKQNSLLDDLIDQSKEGTGLFSPVKFKLAGQDIEFVPKAQRAQADQMAGFGQTSLANSTGMLDSVLRANQEQAKNTFQYSQAGQPNNAGLAYLDQLKGLATTGEEAKLARERIASTEGMASDRLKADSPGTLDKVLGGISAVQSGYDLYDSVFG